MAILNIIYKTLCLKLDLPLPPSVYCLCFTKKLDIDELPKQIAFLCNKYLACSKDIIAIFLHNSDSTFRLRAHHQQ
jgi:hypothetical protein